MAIGKVTQLTESEAQGFGVHADGSPLNQQERRAAHGNTDEFTLVVTHGNWRGKKSAVKLSVSHNKITDEFLRVDIHTEGNRDRAFKGWSFDKQRKARKGKYDSRVDEDGNLWLTGRAGKTFLREVADELAKGRTVALSLLIAHGYREAYVRFWLDGNHTSEAFGEHLGGWRYGKPRR